MCASSSTSPPNITCIRPFSRGVIVAPSAHQRDEQAAVGEGAPHAFDRRADVDAIGEAAVRPAHDHLFSATHATGSSDTTMMPMVTRPKLSLMIGMLPKKNPAQVRRQHPAEAAGDVVGLEARVRHARDARDERRAGADDRHEARQHDRHRAVLEEEGLGALQVLDLEEPVRCR